ncbi:MAG: O-methyltransferase [Phaeodactylibacter sp.]|nr:O-methyltransferase [Phaeodactylibacter sp.]MCB9272713.1 O-methyltransferase [Lewinellaceae bacterium]
MKDLATLLNAYCEAHTSPQPPTLYELERETHLKTLAPQMLSGHLQGQFLSLLSKLHRPKLILEIGTFTGYSAICLAQGLQEGGRLHTIEANAELEYLIRKYVAKAGLEQRITLHIGDALEIIPSLEGPFDMVFIDAGKQDYIRYYDMVAGNLNPGGLIIADNVLWDGKVVNEGRDQDPDARSLHEFNEMVQRDPSVENIMLPVRDGLLVVRKLGET